MQFSKLSPLSAEIAKAYRFDANRSGFAAGLMLAALVTLGMGVARGQAGPEPLLPGLAVAGPSAATASAQEPAEKAAETLPDAPSVAASASNSPWPAEMAAGAPEVVDPTATKQPGEPASMAVPALFASSSASPDLAGPGSPGSEYAFSPSSKRLVASAGVPLDQCPFDKTGARECRVHWKPLILSASAFLAFENAGNLYTGYWYRYETFHGKWWDRYVNSVEGWRWNAWSDNNPFLDDYVGHPYMGDITDMLWIQNDPKGMTLEQGNNWPYYRSRLRALAFSTFYSFEWKFGPIGEAAIGHNGDHYFHDGRAYTNETGWVELVTTPVGGLGWTFGEDALDKHVIRKLEGVSKNPILLTTYQLLTPGRGFANILRLRPPWYRDSRVVKARTFFSDPGEGMTATTAASLKAAHQYYGEDSETEAVISANRPSSPLWEGPGGRHELGVIWGVSLISGHVWGYEKDTKYMPVDIRYSYELIRHKQQWALRYSPELTALAMVDWPTPTPKPKGTVFNQRQRAYGSGLSPVGFQWGYKPLSKVQPFLSTDGGFIYFGNKVLSPQGSQFMYTIDFGGGINFYHLKRQAVTIGYRYQHLSNANISLHNPGMDASTFYVGISRFRNKGQ